MSKIVSNFYSLWEQFYKNVEPQICKILRTISILNSSSFFLEFIGSNSEIDRRRLIMGNILTNFMQNYAEIRAKSRTKNTWGWSDMVLNF